MQNRLKNHKKIRQTVLGTTTRPRLAVYRSLDNLFAQVIDDTTGRTLAAASSLKEKGNLTKKAQFVGAEIAKKAAALKIKSVVYDRGGFTYQGTIKILATAAREAGMEF